MNTDTGQIYRTEADILEAIERGENVVPVSDEVAELMELGKEAIQKRNRWKEGMLYFNQPHRNSEPNKNGNRKYRRDLIRGTKSIAAGNTRGFPPKNYKEKVESVTIAKEETTFDAVV